MDVLHAADLFAPAPPVGGGGGGSDKASAGMPYDDAIELIANAVSKVDPSMVRATHNAFDHSDLVRNQRWSPLFKCCAGLNRLDLESKQCVLLQPCFMSLCLRVGVTTQTKQGEIVRMMAAEGWIEATSGASKAPGAYCTGFPKEREPRVYMSAYSGSFTNVSTLAHELGHAYHSWVMRDMPLPETHYPMNLAETVCHL